MHNLEWKNKSDKTDITNLKEAIRLSLLKWRYIVKNNGSREGLLLNYPEMKELAGTCGLCELANKFDDNINIRCTINEEGIECPLTLYNKKYKIKYNCNGLFEMLIVKKFDEDEENDEDDIKKLKDYISKNPKVEHPWSIWNENNTVKNAEAVLKLIESIVI